MEFGSLRLGLSYLSCSAAAAFTPRLTRSGYALHICPPFKPLLLLPTDFSCPSLF